MVKLFCYWAGVAIGNMCLKPSMVGTSIAVVGSIHICGGGAECVFVCVCVCVWGGGGLGNVVFLGGGGGGGVKIIS